MNQSRKKAHARLRDLAEVADAATITWAASDDSKKWKLNVETALRKLLGDENIHLQKFQKVRFSPVIFFGDTSKSEWHDAFLRGVKSARTIISAALEEFEEYEIVDDESSIIEPLAQQLSQENSKSVFVVHGHDDVMRESVARFLEKLDLTPIILHECPNGGDTIIEKFLRHTNVSYAIVLLSPDDEGRSKLESEELQDRARQNVILELGFFVGKLGRENVFPMIRDPLEIPSDILGVAYVSYADDWKLKLVRELKHAGFEVDANRAV